MTDSESRFALCAVLFVVGLAAPAKAQPSPLLCNTTANNPVLREEGYTETVGDLLIVCTGGTPTAIGSVVPAADFTVTLGTNITSKVTAATASNAVLFNESLMLVDEPNTNSGIQHPVLNCGQTGAPDSDPAAPGVCSITSSDDPGSTYDGSAGHPNVFQGRVADSAGFTPIKFVGVPVDPPGMGKLRFFRITNLRANAADFTGCSMTTLCTIVATVNVTFPGTTDPFIGNMQAGFILPGLVSQITNTHNWRTPATVRITEGFPYAWRAKNISFVVGDHSGTPGNATNGTYDGGTNYPDDIAQNVLNALFAQSTEGGFQWQNDSTNGPPSPNPPGPYFGTILDLGNPLDSVGFGGFNTGINGAGTVNSGTRVALSFSALPSGFAMQVPTVIYLHSTLDSTINSGVMVLTNTDTHGAGPYSKVAGTNGTSIVSGGLAVYEVLYADVNAIEYADIPCTLTGPHGPGPKTDVNVTVSLAPFYAPGSGADQAKPNAQFASPTTVPRFGPGSPAVLFPAKGKP